MSNDDKLIRLGRDRFPDEGGGGPLVPRRPDYTPVPGEEPAHLLDYWHIITSRKWTVILVAVLVFTIVFIATLKQVPVYSASTSLQIERENNNILTFQDIYQSEVAADDTLQTQFRILESRTLARRVVEELELDKHADYQPDPEGILDPYLNMVRYYLVPPASTKVPGEPDRLRPIIDRYLRNVTVTPVRLARLVRVNIESHDPELGARIANAHANHFIEQNFEFKWEATQKASSFLSDQTLTLKANLERAEEKLQAYGRANQIMFTDEGRNTASEKLSQLEEEFTKAQADRFQKEGYDRLVTAGAVDSLPQLMTNMLISNLSSRLAELKREESELAATFGPDYPRRKRLRNQIEDLEGSVKSERRRIADTVHSEYLAAVEREKLMAGALKDQRDLVNKINQEIIQYNILKREVDSNKQLYDGLLTRLKEAGVSAGLRASNIRIVDRAEVPTIPVRPRKTMNILLGLLGGLLLGVGLAFFQEYIDSTIKSPDDVERHLRVPLLGSIPKLGSLSEKVYGYGYNSGSGQKDGTDRKARVELVSHESPSSSMGEAYRSMRTSLLLSSPHHPPKSVVVTSAVPSEGKTVTAINTAISLTQTGTRVVLIDGDMRKPRLHTVLPPKEMVGLSNFLTGNCALKDIIHPTTVPGLFIVPCGAIPPNPAELILTERFEQMMKVLEDYFDYVVLDSPPLANVSDARIIATHTDAAILVIKAFSTSRQLARKALDYLEEARTRVAGIVLNDVDVRSKTGYRYGGGYYGGNYGGYYGYGGNSGRRAKAQAKGA